VSLCGVPGNRSVHSKGVVRWAPHIFRGHISHKMCSSTFDAVTLHVRICAGGGQQWLSLPRPKIENIPVHALQALANHDWPGNIRELQNVIERSVVLSNGPELHISSPEITSKPAPL